MLRGEAGEEGEEKGRDDWSWYWSSWTFNLRPMISTLCSTTLALSSLIVSSCIFVTERSEAEEAAACMICDTSFSASRTAEVSSALGDVVSFPSFGPFGTTSSSTCVSVVVVVPSSASWDVSSSGDDILCSALLGPLARGGESRGAHERGRKRARRCDSGEGGEFCCVL